SKRRAPGKGSGERSRVADWSLAARLTGRALGTAAPAAQIVLQRLTDEARHGGVAAHAVDLHLAMQLLRDAGRELYLDVVCTVVVHLVLLGDGAYATPSA